MSGSTSLTKKNKNLLLHSSHPGLMSWREVFMRTSHKAIFAGLVLSLTTSLTIVAPVHAQVAADATDAFSAAGQGSEGRQTGDNTLAQTSQTNAAGANAPSLQGTT